MLHGLAHDDCMKACHAFQRLYEHNHPYAHYVDQHDAWLGSNEQPTNHWSFSDISSPGVEGALWPHMYPTADYCDMPIDTLEEPSDDESDDEDGNNCNTLSSNATFAVKLCSPILDSSSWYDLAAFVYGRWLFRTIYGATCYDKKKQVTPCMLDCVGRQCRLGMLTNCDT